MLCLGRKYVQEGGLGVRDRRKVNKAFMTKLGWQILFDKDSLWVEMVKKKDLRHGNFLSIASKPTDSYTWRSILRGRETLTMGIGTCISNGRSTSFCYDNWIEVSPLIYFTSRPISDMGATSCVDEFSDEFHSWNLEALKEVLPTDLVSKIISISIDTDDAREDSIYWKFESDGMFTTKYPYELHLQPNLTTPALWSKVWALFCPNKLKGFIWRVLQGSLTTASFLHLRHIASHPPCFRCGQDETILHALRDSNHARHTCLLLNPTMITGNLPWRCIVGLFQIVE